MSQELQKTQTEDKFTYERPGHGIEPVNAAASQYKVSLHKDLAFDVTLTTHDRAAVLYLFTKLVHGDTPS